MNAKSRTLPCSLLTLSVALTARAEDASPPQPDNAITGNAAVASDYMFRGISQTWGGPAVQGGGDVALKNGIAAGFWASSVSENSYPGALMELDLYASYGADFNDGWSWRAGLYGYVYPGGNLDDAKPPLPSRSFSTLEANAALSWKWLTLKYSYSLTDYFAIDTGQGYDGDSKGTQYVQLDAVIPLSGQWSLALHAARTDIPARLVTPLVNGASNPSYSDFGATLKWQFATPWNASLGVTQATNGAFYRNTASLRNTGDTLDVGGTRGFVMLQATF